MRPRQPTSTFRKNRRTRFRSKPKCSVCKRQVDFGDLCYYCRKRRTS